MFINNYMKETKRDIKDAIILINEDKCEEYFSKYTGYFCSELKTKII